MSLSWFGSSYFEDKSIALSLTSNYIARNINFIGPLSLMV